MIHRGILQDTVKACRCPITGLDGHAFILVDDTLGGVLDLRKFLHGFSCGLRSRLCLLCLFTCVGACRLGIRCRRFCRVLGGQSLCRCVRGRLGQQAHRGCYQFLSTHRWQGLHAFETLHLLQFVHTLAFALYL